jgi:ribonuclease R
LSPWNVPLLYRIHEEPNPEKIEDSPRLPPHSGTSFDARPILSAAFSSLQHGFKANPKSMSFVLDAALNATRALHAQNAGHFGLAMKTYTHFTSPIRRYPDLIVHRILREVIQRGREGNDGSDVDLGAKHTLKRVSWPVLDEERETELRTGLVAIGEQSSERERAAADAERELMDWRKAAFMVDRVGDEFDGVVTGVKDYGFYVELDEYFIEGLVHISVLTDDVYEFQERRHRLMGQRTRREFRLGDRVRVSVNRVDQVRHLIDFSVVEV